MAIYKIYCDESRITRFKYMLVGGIWIPQKRGWDFVNEFENRCAKDVCLRFPMSHMKWTKIPNHPEGKYFEAYKCLIDLYFEFNNANQIFFRSLVTESSKYDFNHPIYYEGDYEKGFYNLYCQLILYWLERGDKYKIRVAQRPIKKIDEKDSEYLRLRNLKDRLNNKFVFRINRYTKINISPPVSSIEARTAKNRRLIQLADILMGALGFYWNNEHLKQNPMGGKYFLAKYIANKLGKSDLCYSTTWREKKFNIFHFDTSKTK